MLRRPNASFGPVVVHTEGTADFDARCYSGGVMCIFDVGGTCTHVKPSRKIETEPATPDWCEMKSSALEDAREMADFSRMGLDRMGRLDLLAEAKRIPDEFRPRPLTKAKAHTLRRAIRKARLASDAP